MLNILFRSENTAFRKFTDELCTTICEKVKWNAVWDFPGFEEDARSCYKSGPFSGDGTSQLRVLIHDNDHGLTLFC